MSGEKTKLQEGTGTKPTTARPDFPQIQTVDLGPSEGASVGTKPATPRPAFPNPQQQTQPAPQNAAPPDKGK
jgi:hypothetical protein